MKKNRSLLCFSFTKGGGKFLSIFRFLILLMIGIHINTSIYSQNTKLNLNIKNQTIRDVFKEIEAKSNFHFFYGNNLMILDKVVNEDFENVDVEQILNRLLSKSEYSYKILENNLIVIAPNNFINRQSNTITGIVVDAKTGEALPGVSIVIDGTTQGIISDVYGKFTINLPTQNLVLSFSYIGYISKKVTVTDGANLEIKLSPELKNLDEVVVVGYGTQKKANLTGAVGNIQMSEMESRPLTDASLALQGTVSGVYALQNSGQPGADNATINIRGVGSFTNSSPLVLIDGFAGSLSDVNPNDIKSISVLKDAASSSIYGSRAANGVILVTTKTGSSGKMTVNYSGYIGIQEATALPEVLNSSEYATLYNEASINSGGNALYTEAEIQKFADHSDPLYPDVNYFDVYYGSAKTQSHRISLSGGNDMIQFAFMLGRLNQDGILVGTNYEKTDFRSNIDSYFLKDKRLRFSAKISGNLGTKTEPTDLWSTEWYATLAPIYALKDTADRWLSVNGEDNFYARVKEGSTRITKRYDFNGQIEAEYKIIEGLSVQVTSGYNVISSNENAFHSNLILYTPTGGSKTIVSDLTVTDETDIQTMFTSLIKYNKTFNKHTVNLMAGYSEEEFTYDWNKGYRSNFVNNTQRVLNLGAASTQTNDASSKALGLRSYFGRLNYNYDDKYLLEANIRRDGSSRFLSGHQWGTFPSFSAGWVISKESFMNDLSWLEFLKLRASWGQLGNENIGNDRLYNGYDQLTSGQNYTFGGTLYSGVAITTMTNKYLTWEISEQQNIGLDVSLKNGFDLTLDYFNKLTKNQILTGTIPLTQGNLTAPKVNSGTLQNKGIEIALAYHKRFDNGLKISTSINVSHIVNKIKDLGDVAETKTSPKATLIGTALNSFYGYKMDGIYQTSDFDYADGVYTLKSGVVSVSNYTAQPGDIKYKDLNGDGTVDMTNDRTIIGKQFPDYTYSLNIKADWKGIDLGVFLQGVQGIEGYTYYEISTPFSGFANLGSWWKDRWTTENPSNTLPRLTLDGVRNNIHSSFYVENASYLRLKNIEIGYSLPKKLVSVIGIGSVRVYGNIQNALTLCKFKGFDPEQETDQTRAEAFPQTRIFTMGVNVNF